MVFIPVSDIAQAARWYSAQTLTFRDPDGNLLMVCQRSAP
jgi:hypothetical protein